MGAMETDAIREAVDLVTVRRVFGEPFEKNGVTIVSVAKVRGAGGGGGPKEVGGSGFAVDARPVGVFEIRSSGVRWIPAIDVNRAVLGGQIVAIVALLTLRMLIKRRR